MVSDFIQWLIIHILISCFHVKLSQVWSMGVPANWLCVRIILSTSFFDHLFNFWCDKMLQIHVVLSLPLLELAISLRGLEFLLVEGKSFVSCQLSVTWRSASATHSRLAQGHTLSCEPTWGRGESLYAARKTQTTAKAQIKSLVTLFFTLGCCSS